MNERIEAFRLGSQVEMIGHLLDSIQKAEDTAHGNQRMTKMLRQALATHLWKYLPPTVIRLELGDTVASRPLQESMLIPASACVHWTLPDVDHYAAGLAGKINKPWQPRFQ